MHLGFLNPSQVPACKGDRNRIRQWMEHDIEDAEIVEG